MRACISDLDHFRLVKDLAMCNCCVSQGMSVVWQVVSKCREKLLPEPAGNSTLQVETADLCEQSLNTFES